jgi:hypothetical protein
MFYALLRSERPISKYSRSEIVLLRLVELRFSLLL